MFVLLVGGSYRTWRFFGRDDITAPFRDRLPALVAKGVSCAWCLGTWIAVAGAFLVHRYATALPGHWLWWAVAVACGVGLMERVDE